MELFVKIPETTNGPGDLYARFYLVLWGYSVFFR